MNPIPNSISRQHVIAAMERLGPDSGQWPPKRLVKHFDLIHPDPTKAWRMPPKLVLSVAALIATGSELGPQDFYGGPQSNRYLERLGFKIIDRRKI
jgi:hypothetical protein